MENTDRFVKSIQRFLLKTEMYYSLFFSVFCMLNKIVPMCSFTRLTVDNRHNSQVITVWNLCCGHIIKRTNYLSIFCNFYLQHTFQFK